MTANRKAPAREHLGTDEIGAAFDQLSSDDKMKLGAVEAHLLGGTGLGKGDLVHEALYRTLDGKRQCPRDVPFVAFLVETMKSVASHARQNHKRSVHGADPPEHLCSDGSEPSSAPSAEDEAAAAATVEEILGHFADDQEALLVLMGWADGLRGKALREASGLDQAGLDYAAKRIRARMRTLYPDGWIR